MNNLDKNLEFLNEKQIEAVKKTEGSLLILAGAGSGKTKVLTLKIYYILASKKALPNQILAVTFTNKAANEMKSRVGLMVNQPVDGWWIGTFHSISARILRRNAEYVGLKNNFVIIDRDDQIKLIKNICEAEKIDLKEKNPKYFLNYIDRYKNDYLTVKKIFNEAKTRDEKIIAKIYQIYEKELIRLNCCDFGNLLLHCLYIFKNNKNILQKYQTQFRYILVDEYQDTNLAQQEWLKFIYDKNKNICCVGDDDQSIYSWRGADIRNILGFEKVFNLSKVIRLEQNYRSTKRILNCASHLINYNKGRYGKTLWSKNNQGDKIEIRGFWEVKEEAKVVSNKIENLISKKNPLSEIAILMRVAAHTRSFEERFLNIGLPYKIIGGIKFYERKEIKDVISYLRIANNLSDNLALERILNVPKRGIGQTTHKKISLISRKKNISFFEASKLFIESNNNSKLKQEINNLISKIIKWNKLKKQINHIDLCELILEDSGYINFLQNDDKKNIVEGHDRIDNVNEFLNSLKEFENLEGFLEHISLVSENESNSDQNKISLMTMHSAKGLEFNYVFLIGWEEGLFPSKRSIEEKGNIGLEEERRLAYVALTRAKKNAFISFVSQNRYAYASHDVNLPSRFISELPKEDLDLYNSEIFYQENDNDFTQYDSEDINQLTPGKKRLIENQKNKSDYEWDINQDKKIINNINFNEGERIFHEKFGYGRILEIDGKTGLINFEKSGIKAVFLNYITKL